MIKVEKQNPQYAKYLESSVSFLNKSFNKQYVV